MSTALKADVIVVGAGIAGLMAALKVSPLRAIVVCKNRLGSGAATDWAQGGIAAAMGADDSPALHSLDTQAAGAGISDRSIIDILTRDAPARIEELLELGAQFDRTAHGELDLGREAAHNRRRIVRAHGDATGHEILKTLIAAVRNTPSITVIENTIAQELLLHDSRVTGVVATDVASGETLRIHARATILATGGIGHLYARTTNPPEACGDGIAIAARAGAVLADLEFVQFHPTALDIGSDPMPLATEALRGDGATLVNAAGVRFMPAIHPDAELAPRDIVARAIFKEAAVGRVYLDTRAALGDTVTERFPTLAASCLKAGIDPRSEPIPIAPAAHYHMGGISVDKWGRTSLPGLWACGEVSASGMHGANRLASNSLLEALVFATRVAQDIQPIADVPMTAAPAEHLARTHANAEELVALARLRAVMYEHVGLVRNAVGLENALAELATLRTAFPEPSTELANRLAVGGLITSAALNRKESRGSHYRTDFPNTNDALAKRSFSTLQGSL
ncbi:MAG: L-aspartate oxidase [Candidatus Eremiobacteraeota bacterium]|nr:L-aspartate oxidase [Candidatus Eremiobacteraeota bacterium]